MRRIMGWRIPSVELAWRTQKLRKKQSKGMTVAAVYHRRRYRKLHGLSAVIDRRYSRGSRGGRMKIVHLLLSGILSATPPFAQWENVKHANVPPPARGKTQPSPPAP